jgi:thioredoxin reductase
MERHDNSQRKVFDVIIVGAGPSGLGVGILLQKLGIDYIILEKHSVGGSFKKWPRETHFISPSFAGNFFQMPDLNAITPDTSPAFSLQTEHPSGTGYAQYLQEVSDHHGLSILENIEVINVQKKGNLFNIRTSKGDYESTYVIWAAGEFQYPKKASFEGADLCVHYSEIISFSDLEGEDYIIIGAYESGFDSTFNLVRSDKKITLIDSYNYLDLITSDSSYSLSPFTRDRIREIIDQISYHKEIRVEKVEFENGKYIVTTTGKHTFESSNKPINCTGFDSSLSLVKELFQFKGKYPLLNDSDESTIIDNLFLVGPQVKHGDALFCFVFKYRQRFAIVAEEITKRIGMDSENIRKVIQEYKSKNFYLKDLSATGDEIIC